MILVITVAVRRNYDTASASFLLSDTSQYAVTMIQHPHCFFFLIRHSLPSLWYQIGVVSSFWYLTVRRHYEITSASFIISDTSQYAITLIHNWRCFFSSDTLQYAVTLIQRPRRFFLLIRHSTPSLWYNVLVVSSCWYVTVRRHYDTTSGLFLLSNTSQYSVFDTTSSSFLLADTSQYAVTMMQRPRRFFLLIRHSTPSLWYNVLVVSSVWYVTVRHHFDIKLASFLLSDASQYAVTMIQRRVVSSVWYVTVRNHFDTKLASFLLADTSQYAVTLIQRPRRFFLLIRHSTPSLWYNVGVVSSF